MKTKFIAMAAATLALGSSAFADVTVNITGATAFRVATLDSIKARFQTSGQPWAMAYAGGNSFNANNQVIFQGTFPDVPGVTTIRTAFNGSVEGIKALVDSPTSDPAYLPVSTVASITKVAGGNNSGNGLGGVPAGTETAASDIAFSDVGIASTPFAGATLEPSTPEAGVVVFSMVANEGAPTSLTNLNTQNFRALMGQGRVKLSFITGNANDTNFVYATGRNDGSGTRTTYLAESGYGIANLVNQYIVGASTNGAITAIYRVPALGTNAAIAALNLIQSSGNASTIWNTNQVGNGGYSSSGSLRTDMGLTSSNSTVYSATGAVVQSNANINLVTFMSAGDAGPARTAGAKVLAYNGVLLDGLATNSALTSADEDKVENGAYTAWSYQQMYRAAAITTGDKVTVYNGIKNNLVLGTTGLPVANMNVGRQVDGGVVLP